MGQSKALGFAACALASSLWGCGFFFGKIARTQNNGGIAARHDVAGGIQVNGEIQRDYVVVEKVERPDVECGARQIDAARRFCGDAHVVVKKKLRT